MIVWNYHEIIGLIYYFKMKKGFLFQTTAMEKYSGVDDVPKYIIKALNKCMMTSRVKKDFLCISDRNQPGHFQSHFFNKQKIFRFFFPGMQLKIFGGVSM